MRIYSIVYTMKRHLDKKKLVKMMTKVEEIVKIIRERIRNETYTSRQRLPSEYQLAQEFDVSRLEKQLVV